MRKGIRKRNNTERQDGVRVRREGGGAVLGGARAGGGDRGDIVDSQRGKGLDGAFRLVGV